MPIKRIGAGFSQLKQTLIENSLAYVHKYGWNDRAIHAACAALDLSPASHRLVTPYQLISHCMARWNAQALRKLEDSNFEGKRRIGEKV
jgi:ubiquinone biosynthesis protein COQ9